jgi:hypothetical protein
MLVTTPWTAAKVNTAVIDRLNELRRPFEMVFVDAMSASPNRDATTSELSGSVPADSATSRKGQI